MCIAIVILLATNQLLPFFKLLSKYTESGNAETMLRKAGEFMSILENSNLSSPSITEIKRRYNLTQARVDDGNRKFLEVSTDEFHMILSSILS